MHTYISTFYMSQLQNESENNQIWTYAYSFQIHPFSSVSCSMFCCCVDLLTNGKCFFGIWSPTCFFVLKNKRFKIILQVFFFLPKIILASVSLSLWPLSDPDSTSLLFTICSDLWIGLSSSPPGSFPALFFSPGLLFYHLFWLVNWTFLVTTASIRIPTIQS